MTCMGITSAQYLRDILYLFSISRTWWRKKTQESRKETLKTWYVTRKQEAHSPLRMLLLFKF